MTLPLQWLQTFMTCVLITKKCQINVFFVCAKGPSLLLVYIYIHIHLVYMYVLLVQHPRFK